MYATISICPIGLLLTLPDQICESCIKCRLLASAKIIIISTFWHTEETAHLANTVPLSIHMDDLIFYEWPHFLSVNPRKSRNSWFSIRSRNSSASGLSFWGRFLGRGSNPSFICLSFRFSQLSSCFTTYLSLNPKYSAISRLLFPAASIARISGNRLCTRVYFSLDITIPPNVVLLFSYIRGCFVYCPFLLDLFMIMHCVFFFLCTYVVICDGK